MPTRDADPAEHGLYFRDVELERGTLDEDARTVRATLSTENKVQRFFGSEVLDHSPKAVNLTRAARGLPLLFSHDQHAPIGRVEAVELNDSRLEGRLRFSRNARAEEVWQDVREGILADVSIGYRVGKWEDVEGGRIARKWDVLEASVVAVPADTGAQIHREETVMTEATTPAVPVEAPNLEAIRRNDIVEAFRNFPQHAGLMLECLNDPACAVESARGKLLDQLGAPAEPVQSIQIQAGKDDREKFAEALDRALAVKLDARPHKGGVLNYESQRLHDELTARHENARSDVYQNPLSGMSLIELAREHTIRYHDPDARSWNAAQVADRVLTRAMGGLIGHHPDDFTNLLANNVGKMLQVGYVEAPETWQQWCKVGSFQDFKTAGRPVMSTFGDLDDITDDKEYKYGTFSDFNEDLTPKTFGKLFSISRTAIVNDDQNAFSEIPRHMGRAAARMVGDEVYSILTTNGNMSDGSALFVAGHSNITASGAAPSVAQLNAAYTVMATQTDPASNTLNVLPRYIMVPAALYGTTRALLASELITGSANNDTNIWQGALEQVTEPRLDADSVVQWYLAASPNAIGTVEVAFLNGQQAPYLEQQDGFTRDGAIYKVRLDVGSLALDWRGLYRNAGA